MTDACENALRHAEAGFRVIPLAPGEKRPVLREWQREASNDPAVIQKWFRGHPTRNVGIAAGLYHPNGSLAHFAVVDLDCKDGKDGAGAFADLAAQHGGVPATLETTTPNGRHLYFRCDREVGNSVGALAVGVDVRGAGGQVVAPGSVLKDGRTYTSNGLPMADCPPWLLALLPVPGATLRDPSAPRKLEGIDAERAAKKAVDYLTTVGPAIEGAGGDDATIKVAMELHDIGLDPEDALEAMLEHWNDRCSPPWEMAELRQKVHNAYRSAQTPQGSGAPEAVFLPVEDAAPAAREKYNLLSVGELLKAKPPSWLVRGLLPDHGMGVVYGAPGSGKSFLVLDLAAAIARGITWAGQRTKTGAVVYIGLEGRVAPRVAAYLRSQGIQPADLAALHVIERQGLNLLADASRDAKQLVTDIEAAELGPVAMVVVDTLNRAMPGGNENASEDMGRAIRAAGIISSALGCLTLFVHHSGKDTGKGARGHSSLLGAADAELEVARGPDGETRFLEATKVKDGEDGGRFSFRLKVVDLGATRDHDPMAEAHERDTSCVIENLGPAFVSRRATRTTLTPPREVALRALRQALQKEGDMPDWDESGSCTFDAWRDAYFTLVPPADDPDPKERRRIKDSARKNFDNARQWLIQQNMVTAVTANGRSEYRLG